MRVTQFNLNLPHHVVLYLRMSTKGQNKRSPDQQKDEIERTMKLLGCPWHIVKMYRDDAKSGRRQGSRPGYMQMLQDIRRGKVRCSFILVDTLERFGRHKYIEAQRNRLQDENGVLVLAADNQFSDPTSQTGEVYSMLEAHRARELSRIMGHNVSRGQRDAVQLKHWPAGAAPFGYRLKRVFLVEGQQSPGDFSILEPDPATAGVIKLLFETAVKTGYGLPRLARSLNEHPDVPAEHKPIGHTVVAHWLDNLIYKGVMVWGKTVSDIVADRSVHHERPIEDHVVVPDFCEPLVSAELWDEAQRLRLERSHNSPAGKASKTDVDAQLNQPVEPSLALKYPLSGLLFCSRCGNRMTIASSPEYQTKAGEIRRYVSYRCPGRSSAACSNRVSISAEWLVEQVLKLVMDRLFPNPNV